MKRRENGAPRVAVIGLGYVGIQLAVAFAKHTEVIGYDINEEKIALYRSGVDITREVGDGAIARSGIHFTADAAGIRPAEAYIVAVPTPVDRDNRPDLQLLRMACASVGEHLAQDDLVIFESTVYPGVTEEICIPALEQASGLRCGEHFHVGYSPERVSPGDSAHAFGTVDKLVAGWDRAAHERAMALYRLILDPALLHPARDIRTAEASKVMENTQRDLLIAFANEMAGMCKTIGLDLEEVVSCASTKWNFCNVHPGLVGGHCIGVDPYYLIALAERRGCELPLVRAARQTNEGVLTRIVEELGRQKPEGARRVLVLGATYKADVPDLRNSKALELAGRLHALGYQVTVMDDLVSSQNLPDSFPLTLTPETDALADFDVVVIAVGHSRYLTMDLSGLRARCNGDALLVDLDHCVPQGAAQSAGFRYWGLW